MLTRRNYPLSFNEFENIISRKADLFAPILHGACNFTNLGFRKVEDDTLPCHFFDVLNVQRRMMPYRREVEREILKIIKEIADIKWSIKNEVLTDRQKEVKRNKIRELKTIRKNLTKQVEGWRVRRVSSQKQ